MRDRDILDVIEDAPGGLSTFDPHGPQRVA
jgi:hypothetical protein